MFAQALAAAIIIATHSAAGLATGVKVGEVTSDSAMVWVRATANAERHENGLWFAGRPAVPVPDGVAIEQLKGACPGAPGDVRVRYGTSPDLDDAAMTEWMRVESETDFAHSFTLDGLEPATEYFYAAEARDMDAENPSATLRGRFVTAPIADTNAEIAFTVVTGMYYGHLDDLRGFHIYEAMRELAPDFHVLTGDTVYYDSDSPRVTSLEVASYHWQRMYSLPRLVDFHLAVPAYWEKDDHDTYHDDCWPGMVREKMGAFTFDEGLKYFLDVVPMGDKTYRTARWGKALEVWFVEGRDFRSPNTMEDGPDKTIWGDEQKQWLKETLLASDADWKVLVSPTPIVGPDREKKADNHANAAFAHEGNEMRAWFAENLPDNFFIVCGDRHWQYHSVDPKTGVQEFSCGPASNEHAGGSPGEDPDYHQFHRMEGGFLSVTASPAGDTSALAFRFHDVHGAVVYEKVFE
jgi:alkaline phosphatase D